MKNRKAREKLVQAVQLRADTTLRHCAILNNDARILAITSRDIVAAEAHYHASCKTKECDHVGDKEVENFSTCLVQQLQIYGSLKFKTFVWEMIT